MNWEEDRAVSLHPYFQVTEGKDEEARLICKKLVDTAKTEDNCLTYAWTFSGSGKAFCQEVYRNSEALIFHLKHVKELIAALVCVSKLVRVEVHCAAEDIPKLEPYVSPLGAVFYTIEHGVRRKSQNSEPLNDAAVTANPYYKFAPERESELKSLCEEFLEPTKSEPGCLAYAYSFNGNTLFFRQVYQNADGLLDHKTNVGSLLDKLWGMIEIEGFEIHCPESELVKLQPAFASISAEFFVKEFGFRR